MPEKDPVTLSIAGMGVQICCRDDALRQALSRRYADFSIGTEAPFILQVEVGTNAPVERMFHPQIQFQTGQVSFSEPGYEGKITLAERRGWLRAAGGRLEEKVDYYLRVIYCLLSYESGGMLFHAAGIMRQGRAYLFFGHSGSGKTTVARLSPDDLVLNDDLVALLPAAGGWQAYATPFWNPTQVRPIPLNAPLVGLYRLVQDRRVYVEALSGALALAEVIASVPVVNEDPGRGPGLIAICSELLASVPAYRLHFLPDDSFWKVIVEP